MLSVTLMSMFFVRFLKRPQPTSWFGYAISTVFMLYTLYIGGLVLAVQGMAGLLAWRTSRRNKLALIGAWIASVLLYIPWLVLIPKQLSFISTGISPLPTSWAGFITSAGVLLGGQLALTGGLYALGLWRVIERRDNTSRWLAQFTILFSGVGLYGLMFVANLKFGLLAARTIVLLAPMFMAICGYGLSLIEGRARNLLVIALFIVLPATTAPIQPRLDYAAAAQAIAANYMPSDLVILENGWDDNAFRYELMLALGESAAPDIMRTLPWVDNRDLGQPVLPKVEPLIQTRRRVWLVNWLQPSQVSPFLDSGGDGFRKVLIRETSTGSQYQFLFTDQTVRETLYERPIPDVLAQFGDGLVLRDAIVPQQVAKGQQRLQLDLWWSTIQPLAHDYSVSVFLLDSAGIVRAQSDQPPGGLTSQWPMITLEFDRHTIALPTDLPTGVYKVGVDVYWYGDNQRLSVTNLRQDSVTTQSYVVIGQLQVTP